MTSRNPYLQYYVNQAGSGLGSFEGIRYQRGKGFFGSLLREAALPLLNYLGKQFLRTGVDVGNDYISGVPITEALKSRTKRKLRDIAGDAANRALVFEQTGRGGKRRRSNKKKSSTGSKKKPKRKSKPAKNIKPQNFSLF